MATANNTTPGVSVGPVQTAQTEPQIFTTTLPAPIGVGVPEELFIVHPGAKREINTDVLACCLNRAEALVAILQIDGTEGEFNAAHHVVMGTLGALDGILGQMRAVLNRGA